MAGFGSLAPMPNDPTGMSGLDPADVSAALGKAGDVASRTWIGQLLAGALPTGETVHTLPITPKLREAAKGGFPLFSAGAPVPQSAPDDQSAPTRVTIDVPKRLR